MMLTAYQIWVLLAEAVGVLVIDRKKLPLFIAVVILTITIFFFFPRQF